MNGIVKMFTVEHPYCYNKSIVVHCSKFNDYDPWYTVDQVVKSQLTQ
jgi:hypothetical protein